eukprot:scaffold2448_cov250-Pinguiococcus_pyrenoidosus.AAC.13
MTPTAADRPAKPPTPASETLGGRRVRPRSRADAWCHLSPSPCRSAKSFVSGEAYAWRLCGAPLPAKASRAFSEALQRPPVGIAVSVWRGLQLACEDVLAPQVAHAGAGAASRRGLLKLWHTEALLRLKPLHRHDPEKEEGL